MNVRTGRQRSEVCKAKENRSLLRGLRLWVSVWLVGATSLLIPETAFAQVEDSSDVRITIRVNNYAQASRASLGEAKRETGRILGTAGVRIAWLDCRVGPSTIALQNPCQGPLKIGEFMLRILSQQKQNTSRERVFGFANAPALASVYYNYALHAQNDHAKFEAHVLLGCVIAHEIGHLLLGAEGHSADGIMQPHLGPKQVRQAITRTLMFTSRQSKLLRAAARRRMWLDAVTLEGQRMPTADLTTGLAGGRRVARVGSGRIQNPAIRPMELHSQEPPARGSLPSPTALVPVAASLDLPAAPAADAYAVTGELLPPFLKAVVSVWNQEIPGIPLSINSLIFVIRPTQFYADLDAQQKIWLMGREMLGIRNFPLIINPLTPDDDWYFRAQQEWKQGNYDAAYILVTSLFHEIAHTQRAADEPAAYKDQLALFERFEKQGKLSSPYAHECHASLRERYLDVKRNPQRYRQVLVNLQHELVALIVPAEPAPPLGPLKSHE
jgi:hypothetical protein